MKYVGIDLGGTNIVSGVVEKTKNGGYQILAKKSCSTNVPRRTEEICEDMLKITVEALKELSLTMNDIEWVGIGIPGSVDPKRGRVGFATNLFVEKWDIVDMMEQRLNSDFLYESYGLYNSDKKLRVFIENDGNAAAFGEFKAGALKGTNNSVALTLGTGIGGGIIIDGKIYSGGNFAGGELGHMVIHKDGIQCTCPRKGCWERYASATGITNMAKKAMQEDKNSYMWQIEDNLDKVNAKVPFDAAAVGDKVAQKVVDEYLSNLACGITNIVNILQPEKICIGGGISKQGDNLIVPLVELVEKERYSINLEKQTQILVAQLGNDAGIIGAALLGELETESEKKA